MDHQPRRDRKLPLASHPSFIIFMLFLTTKSAENIFYSGHTPSLHKDGTIAVGTESGGCACKWGILKPEFYRIASIALGFDQ